MTGPTAAQPVCAATAEPTSEQLVTDIHHSRGHPGVRRTHYFVKRVHPAISRRQVRDVVAACQICQSIDPAPAKWSTGHLGVEGVWQRLGMDITHCRGRSYLTLIDCRPSRFTIWRPLRLQTSACVIEQLEDVFCERGAPAELLTDNDTAFRSRLFSQFAKRWDVHVHFRGAYAPAGNGIVERCHRTVKVIAARKGCLVAEAVYLYNLMPHDDHTPTTAPANMLYKYTVRVRGENINIENDMEEEADNRYQADDKVWVRPPGARCDRRYKKGIVTGVTSAQVVEVDGVPRHNRDLRPRLSSSESESFSSSEDEELLVTFPAPEATASHPAPEDGPPLRRSTRIRRPPQECAWCE